MRNGHSLRWLLPNALRAAAELATARLALQRIRPRDVLERNRRVAEQTGREAHCPDAPETARACDEVAFFINRMAARVPWRADCLVQALAGQNWLARRGIASEIVVGTAKRESGAFESHAWLRHGGRVLLGGDISTYLPMLDPVTDSDNGRSG